MYDWRFRFGFSGIKGGKNVFFSLEDEIKLEGQSSKFGKVTIPKGLSFVSTLYESYVQSRAAYFIKKRLKTLPLILNRSKDKHGILVTTYDPHIKSLDSEHELADYLQYCYASVMLAYQSIESFLNEIIVESTRYNNNVTWNSDRGPITIPKSDLFDYIISHRISTEEKVTRLVPTLTDSTVPTGAILNNYHLLKQRRDAITHFYPSEVVYDKLGKPLPIVLLDEDPILYTKWAYDLIDNYEHPRETSFGYIRYLLSTARAQTLDPDTKDKDHLVNIGSKLHRALRNASDRVVNPPSALFWWNSPISGTTQLYISPPDGWSTLDYHDFLRRRINEGFYKPILHVGNLVVLPSDSPIVSQISSWQKSRGTITPTITVELNGALVPVGFMHVYEAPK